jgi:hypothetical protein
MSVRILLLVIMPVSVGSVWAQPPVWQQHSLWCAHDPGSSGQRYWARRHTPGFDQYESVLVCQEENRDAQLVVTAAGREAVNAFMNAQPAPIGTAASPTPPLDPNAWKIHSDWCANKDRGTSYRAYMNICTAADQFDSVLACQNDALRGNGDGGRAVRAVSDAGRAAVNAFMESKKPSQCLSPGQVPKPSGGSNPFAAKPDFFVSGRFQCNPSGSCSIDVHSRKGCADAMAQFNSEVARRGDVCRFCSNEIDNSKSVKSGPVMVQWGACAVSVSDDTDF